MVLLKYSNNTKYGMSNNSKYGMSNGMSKFFPFKIANSNFHISKFECRVHDGPKIDSDLHECGQRRLSKYLVQNLSIRW
jgi:hypothetical protein